MAVTITPESMENYQRGIEGDRFFGVCDMGARRIHLTLGERGDQAPIPAERRSKIIGVERDVLDGRGGHAKMAQWAGVQARQLGAGVAEGNAYGFMFELVGTDALSLTVRSGFNGQHPGKRPPGTNPRNEKRTLPQDLVEELKLALVMLGRPRITLNLSEI